MERLKLLKQKFAAKQAKELTKLISLVLVTVILLCVAAWAWFANQEKADASGLSISLGASKNLEISLNDGTTYRSSIDLLSEGDQRYINEDNRIKGKLSMIDITSDGKTFQRPAFKDATNGILEPNPEGVWTTPKENIAYITQKIYFRTSFPAKIHLGSNTAVNPLSTTLVGENAGNMVDGYNFSKDCIVGALRISAVNSNGDLIFTAIPNSDIELVDKGIAAIPRFEIITGDTTQNSKTHTYYNASKTSVTKDDVLLDFSTEPEIASATVKGNDGYYVTYATINIWLEGCDAETRRVLSGGQYKINLDFYAVEAEDTTPEATTSTEPNIEESTDQETEYI